MFYINTIQKISTEKKFVGASKWSVSKVFFYQIFPINRTISGFKKLGMAYLTPSSTGLEGKNLEIWKWP